MTSNCGVVYLIGAGPGDPGLITVKGLDCLKLADVVVYDYLANPALLQQARPTAEVVYVGKSAGNHAVPQDDINQLLVNEARAGKTVARLKGGDPFVFGRGGEEAEALVEAGIPFEVVPGVTSAVAAPAYAGIPVTHRDYASTFAVVTGHEDPTKDVTNLDWEALAKGVGTLVCLMGVSNLPAIVDQLLKHGRPKDTPVALIRYGTMAAQQTISGTLENIVERVRQASLKPPAVIVVGDVVSLRGKLRWFDDRPLFGKRVLVTRSREQASDLSALLRRFGAEPIEFPVIEIAPPEDFRELDRSISSLAGYDWIVFTSANGVKAFVKRLFDLNMDVRAMGRAKLGAIGPATAEALQHYGLRVDFVPEQYIAESVAEGLKAFGMAGRKVLVPRAAEAREILPEELGRAGAVVDEVAVYRTLPASAASANVIRLLRERAIDVVTFTSSSTVKNFVAATGTSDPAATLGNALIACIGPITAGTAEGLGLRVGVTAKEYTIPGLVNAICNHLALSETTIGG